MRPALWLFMTRATRVSAERGSVADRLIVKGAREHNLRSVDLDLPRDALIVFTGLSGSGKSSLAFDTIFAEGQRRYVESLSAYARQFLGQMDKPDVDFIEGLSPAVSIDQKSTNRNPRSTVGTITEVYDYLRLLYARAGQPHCPNCGKPISRQTPQQIVDRVLAMAEGTRFQVLAPVVRARKGEYVDLFAELQSKGYARVRVDGVVHPLTEPPKLKKQEKHTIEVVVDRLTVKASARQRLTDSIESALALAGGIVVLDFIDLDEDDPHRERRFSEHLACPNDHPLAIEDQVHVRYRNRYGRERSYYAGFEGVVQWIERRHSDTESDWSREKYEGYMRDIPCGACGGTRLKPEILAVTIAGKNIAEVCALS